MTRGAMALAGVVILATLATVAVSAPRRVLWNATASIPTGLYLLRGNASLHVGERVAIAPPTEVQRLLAERRYLPPGVPLLKRIAAVSGQRVCRSARTITIDGRYAGVALVRDRAGRHLPVWSGCTVLRPGELFVLSPAAPDSFDGRYFGVLRTANVIGRIAPIWTDEAGTGDHVWLADPRARDLPTTTSTGE